MANAVSFTTPTDYSTEQAAIERQRRLAEAMQQQGQVPLQTNEMAGGYVVPVSPFAGAAKLLQAFSGQYGQRQADERAKALGARYQADLVKALTGAQTAMQGRPATPAGYDNPNEMAEATPAVAPDRNAAIASLMQHPATQGNATAMLIDALKPKDPIKLGKDDRLLNPTTFDQVVGPAAQPPKFHVVGGSLVPEPTVPTGAQGGGPVAPVAPVFTAPDKKTGPAHDLDMALDQAGIPANDPRRASLHLDLAKRLATHAPAANVSVKTDVKTGESLAQQGGPMMKDSTSIAEGAVKQVDAARRIVQAVDSGKIITGPTADARLLTSQIGQVLGVGGKDDAEKIANTRQAMRGLAELTLQGRQQMKGQGAITESEGKLAERAMSGELSFTAAEIKQLAKASERAARFNYAEHQRKLKVMQENPALNAIAPFYQGPAMPPEAGMPPLGAGNLSPATREFLKQQGLAQ